MKNLIIAFILVLISHFLTAQTTWIFNPDQVGKLSTPERLEHFSLVLEGGNSPYSKWEQNWRERVTFFLRTNTELAGYSFTGFTYPDGVASRTVMIDGVEVYLFSWNLTGAFSNSGITPNGVFQKVKDRGARPGESAVCCQILLEDAAGNKFYRTLILFWDSCGNPIEDMGKITAFDPNLRKKGPNDPDDKKKIPTPQPADITFTFLTEGPCDCAARDTNYRKGNLFFNSTGDLDSFYVLINGKPINKFSKNPLHPGTYKFQVKYGIKKYEVGNGTIMVPSQAPEWCCQPDPWGPNQEIIQPVYNYAPVNYGYGQFWFGASANFGFGCNQYNYHISNWPPVYQDPVYQQPIWQNGGGRGQGSPVWQNGGNGGGGGTPYNTGGGGGRGGG